MIGERIAQEEGDGGGEHAEPQRVAEHTQVIGVGEEVDVVLGGEGPLELSVGLPGEADGEHQE